MIPFLSWGRGGLHDSCTAVELTEEAVKLVGDPDGTAMETQSFKYMKVQRSTFHS